MVKERTDSVTSDREHEHGDADLCIEFTVSGRHAVAGYRLFEVIVQILIGIELRNVSGQIEPFDTFSVLFDPRFDGYGVMDTEVIDNEDDLASAVLDELFPAQRRMVLSGQEMERSKDAPPVDRSRPAACREGPSIASADISPSTQTYICSSKAYERKQKASCLKLVENHPVSTKNGASPCAPVSL